MKKRLLMALLALSMASASLAGCGSEKPVEESSVLSDQSSEAVQESSKDSESKESEASADSESKESSKEDEVQEETPILKEAVLKNFGCRVGCAATEGEMNDPKVWEIITTHFNAITFGNELKPDAMVGYSVGRCPGTEEAELNGETIIVPKLDYSRAERMLNKVYDWNQEHPDDKIMVKGHVLLWHAQTPEWFFHVDYDKNKEYVDKDTMNKRLEWYIRTMLTHFTGPDSKYKDMFYGWDVVNEAIGGQPEIYRTDKENPNESLSEDRHGSNSSWWHVYQSNEFIINAFIYANKYAPADLELYYNDYGECDGKKITRIKQLLTAIKEREGEPGVGTRIDAMGMQAHYDMTEPGFNMFQYAIEQYSSIVGAVNISEFDIKARDSYDGSDEAKEEEYQKQYLRYKILATVMKNQVKEKGTNISSITFWGTTDKYSWLQNTSNVGGGSTKKMSQCPLLFDENGEIKPAFYAFTEE
ncbi:MAG: endo-1,4-beta-xylanase [Acetatifactor sp.]